MSRVEGVDHIAIAVENLDEATRLWRDSFGLREGGREHLEAEGVQVQMMWAGETRIELIAADGPNSPLDAYLKKRGPGLHHLALKVPHCATAAAEVEAAGGQLAGAPDRPGAHGTRIAFVHPKSTAGVLLELVEEDPS